MNSLYNTKVLDVGCGSSKIIGAIGIDQFSLHGVDIVHNLDIYPWPLKDNSFDRIVFSHSISHLNNLSDVLVECYRLLRPNGVVEIVAPHYASDNFNTDPTHKLHLGIRSMSYYCDNVDFGYKYISDNIKFKLIESKISFREAKTLWREILKPNPFKILGFEWLVNKYPRIYERLFCWIIPPSEVYFLIQKI